MDCIMDFCAIGCGGVDPSKLVKASLDGHAQSLSSNPSQRLGTPPTLGTASQFKPSSDDDDLVARFPQLKEMLRLPIQPRRRKVKQLIFSSRNASAELSHKPLEPGDKASEPARIADTNEYAVWFSWSYTKGYHCAFFFIDVEETKLGADNERKLADFINSNEGAKVVFKKRHSVVLTEVTRCSAFAAVFIEAEEDGHLFVGFDPSKSSPAASDGSVQWVIRAPRGSYKPTYYDYDPQKRLRYTPIYAMRSMQKRSLPIAPFGFEPEPAVAKLRQEKLRQDTPGYDKESAVWDSLPPDDLDDDGEKKGEPSKLLATTYEPHDDDNGAGPSSPPHTLGKQFPEEKQSGADDVDNGDQERGSCIIM